MFKLTQLSRVRQGYFKKIIYITVSHIHKDRTDPIDSQAAVDEFVTVSDTRKSLCEAIKECRLQIYHT